MQTYTSYLRPTKQEPLIINCYTAVQSFKMFELFKREPGKLSTVYNRYKGSSICIYTGPDAVKRMTPKYTIMYHTIFMFLLWRAQACL